MSEDTYDRRRFLGAAAMTVAATQLGASRSARAQSGQEFAQAVIDVDSY